VVIDELADVVATAGSEAQEALARLVGRGRGVGLHVVAATQKPTVAAVGSLVQANFPTRIVGRVASAADARVAAGRGGLGAECLLGRGDFLLVSGSTIVRFQGAYEDPASLRDLVQQVIQEERQRSPLQATGTEGWSRRVRSAAQHGWQIVK